MEVETNLVNSKIFKIYELLFYVAIFFLLLFGGLNYDKWGPSMIEKHQLKWFFKDWQTFNLWALYFFFISGAFAMVFGSKYFDHDLGTFKLNVVRLYTDKTTFHFDKMKKVKFSVNSPGVFGRRNVKQGFKNFVEFFVNGEKRRYEFYIENQAMEDALLNLLTELKSKYAVEVTIDTKSKESLFESWFGNG